MSSGNVCCIERRLSPPDEVRQSVGFRKRLFDELLVQSRFLVRQQNAWTGSHRLDIPERSRHPRFSNRAVFVERFDHAAISD